MGEFAPHLDPELGHITASSAKVVQDALPAALFVFVAGLVCTLIYDSVLQKS